LCLSHQANTCCAYRTIVIEELLTQHFQSQDGDERLAYYYCVESGNDVASEPKDVLNSLIRQLCWSPMERDFHPNFPESWKSGQQTKTLDESATALKELLKGGQTTIVIDALDECSDPEKLLESLQKLAEATTPESLVRLFVSCRNNVPVHKYTFSGPGLSFNSVQIEPDKVELNVEQFIKGFIASKCENNHHDLGKECHTKRRENLEQVLIARTGTW
jgi:hypothetical protein